MKKKVRNLQTHSQLGHSYTAQDDENVKKGQKHEVEQQIASHRTQQSVDKPSTGPLKVSVKLNGWLTKFLMCVVA